MGSAICACAFYSTCKWEVSIELEGSRTESSAIESRRLKTTINDTRWRTFRTRTTVTIGLDDTVDSKRRELGTTRPFAMNQREEYDREADEEDSAPKLQSTPLTPSYAHAVLSFKCERSIELKG
jgi:hypothetical protein